MKRIAEAVRRAIPGSTIAMARVEDTVSKLTIRASGVQTKVEVTPVMRGTVHPPAVRVVTDIVQEEFGFAEMQVVSFADLYAGKLVAALDRQHPRDLFDVRDLMANEGITDEVRRAFLVYLISHDRPMFEVLRPTLKALDGEYARGFDGMTRTPVDLRELSAARDGMMASIVGGMPHGHRAFLISFERGKPDWDLLGIPGIAALPAVKWRQLNLDKLSAEKRAALVANLERVLTGEGLR